MILQKREKYSVKPSQRSYLRELGDDSVNQTLLCKDMELSPDPQQLHKSQVWRFMLVTPVWVCVWGGEGGSRPRQILENCWVK